MKEQQAKVLQALLQYRNPTTNEAFPSINTLRKAVRLSYESVIEALKFLEENGFLTSELCSPKENPKEGTRSPDSPKTDRRTLRRTHRPQRHYSFTEKGLVGVSLLTEGVKTPIGERYGEPNSSLYKDNTTITSNRLDAPNLHLENDEVHNLKQQVTSLEEKLDNQTAMLLSRLDSVEKRLQVFEKRLNPIGEMAKAAVSQQSTNQEIWRQKERLLVRKSQDLLDHYPWLALPVATNGNPLVKATNGKVSANGYFKEANIPSLIESFTRLAEDSPTRTLSDDKVWEDISQKITIKSAGTITAKRPNMLVVQMFTNLQNKLNQIGQVIHYK